MSHHKPSIDELERRAELSRVAFAQTVDQLRAEISETSEAIRSTVSPEAIKRNAKDYARRTGQRWYDRAREELETNPLRALAIGALCAYPVVRLVRSVPLPVTLIGAGLLIAETAKSKNVIGVNEGPADGSPYETMSHRPHESMAAKLQRQAGDAVDSAKATARNRLAAAGESWTQAQQQMKDAVRTTADTASEFGSNATARLQDAADSAIRSGRTTIGTFSEKLTNSAAAAADTLAESRDAAKERLTASAEAARDRMANSANAAREALRSSAEAAKERAAATASAAGERLSSVGHNAKDLAQTSFDRTPLLIGGLALAAGAIIAAALPRTEAERTVAGDASEALKREAEARAQQAFQAAKDVVGGVAADIVQKAGETGKAVAEEVGDKVIAVADKAVTTAFELPPEQTTTQNR